MESCPACRSLRPAFGGSILQTGTLPHFIQKWSLPENPSVNDPENAAELLPSDPEPFA